MNRFLKFLQFVIGRNSSSHKTDFPRATDTVHVNCFRLYLLLKVSRALQILLDNTMLLSKVLT